MPDPIEPRDIEKMKQMLALPEIQQEVMKILSKCNLRIDVMQFSQDAKFREMIYEIAHAHLKTPPKDGLQPPGEEQVQTKPKEEKKNG